MTNKRINALAAIAVLGLLCAAAACRSGSTIGGIGGLRVTLLDKPEERGTPEQPLPFSIEPSPHRVTIEALRADGSGELDAGYDGWVVVEPRPSGKLDRSDPLSVQLAGGVAENITVSFGQAHGAVRIVASEEGLVPRADDPANAACNNRGVDDDGDGYADYPNDRGCAHPTDDTEWGGVGAGGASEPLYFANPRLADVQRPHGLGKGADSSALRGLRVTVDTGFLLVTRVGVDGLYVTDFDGVKWDGKRFSIDPLELSYRSVFAFNFSTPRNLQEGDCLVELSGVVEEFYGYTELGKPTWKKGDAAFCSHQAYRVGVEICAPQKQGEDGAAYEGRLEQCRLQLEQLANTPVDITRVIVDAEGQQRSIWDQRFLETERFESALVRISDGDGLSKLTIFTELRSCDRNDNGVIDYFDKQEADCDKQCGDALGCVILETYRRYNQWTVTFLDGLGELRELSIVSAGSIPGFEPTDAQGQPLSEIVGTMRNLSFGKPPWILEPRRPADCPQCISTPK